MRKITRATKRLFTRSQDLQGNAVRMPEYLCERHYTLYQGLVRAGRMAIESEGPAATSVPCERCAWEHA